MKIKMFEHKNFKKISFESVPLNRDIYLMDEEFMEEFEQSLINEFEGGEYTNIGYISSVAARALSNGAIEMSWYPNYFDRFHEVFISLPKKDFIICVTNTMFLDKPIVFVKSEWLNELHLKSYSIFMLIDAIDVKKAIEKNELSRAKFVELREQIDELAAQHTEISFVSFGDSLLLKSNWTIGFYKNNVKYTYQPEIFIYLARMLNDIYKKVLGLNTYTIFTQGSNIFYEDNLLHISKSQNHISLNSLGIPFASLMSIENAARKAIKKNLHDPADLYFDRQFLNSLRIKFNFNKQDLPLYSYKSSMTHSECSYCCLNFDQVIDF